MSFVDKIRNNEYFKNLNISDDVLFDALTKTVSRRCLLSYISYLIKQKTPFSLAVIDIDNFKQFNDNYGHMIGDEILISVTSIMNSVLDENTIVGRYGGDEFIIVSTSSIEYQDRWNCLKSLFVNIRKPITLGQSTFFITCSCGQSAYPVDDTTYDGLFLKADRTLYRAKNKGRNCFVIFDKVKHANLTIQTDEQVSVKMLQINKIFKGKQELYSEIYESFIKISNMLNIDGIALFSKDNKQIIYSDIFSDKLTKVPEDIYESDEDIIVVNERGKTDKTKTLFRYLQENEIKSCVIFRLNNREKILGDIIFYNSHYRLWQETELALITYTSIYISQLLYYNK
ncbi:MAG: GGDEF domain-containing protein [Acholeplasmatales bacterium]|nr:GGDEF domain-containing protein [Acholeplasmatales bacterium]